MHSINNRAKILIVEHKSAQLIGLTIWLSQFAELQVFGSLSGNNLRAGFENRLPAEYDLIIFGLEMVRSEEIPFRLIADFSLLRKLKSKMEIPILLLLSSGSAGKNGNNMGEQIYDQIFNECDSVLSSDHTLNYIHTEINHLLARKQLTHSPNRKLVAVAG